MTQSSPGLHHTTIYSEPPTCRIEAAAASDIFHLPFYPFPIAAGLLVWGGGVCLSAYAKEVLGGVQCAQYRPHPRRPEFNCHGPAGWDVGSEFSGPGFVSACP